MTEKYEKKLIFTTFAALILIGFIAVTNGTTATDDNNTAASARDESVFIGFFKNLFEDEKSMDTEESFSPALETFSVTSGPRTVDAQPPPFPVTAKKTAENASLIPQKDDTEKTQVDGTMSRLLNDVIRIN